MASGESPPHRPPLIPNVVIKRDLYLAINDFTWTDVALSGIAAQVTQGLRTRLAVPPISLVDLSDEKVGFDDMPRFATLRARHADMLMIGRVSDHPKGMKIEFRVWALYNERELTGLQYLGPRDAIDEFANEITIATYDRLQSSGALDAD
ncbi:hypothetical protein [Bradyrhizobium sp. 2TAF24]|uniref:hypothetical protein n=1 Tax=Bradyrhizobium sp. 2TAF24 TaxID=3233011 RepID=UPI003F92688E